MLRRLGESERKGGGVNGGRDEEGDVKARRKRGMTEEERVEVGSRRKGR